MTERRKKSSKKGSERRTHPRVETSISVIAKTPASRRIKTDRIRNLSLGGVFIATDEELKFGLELKLEFTLPGEKTPIACVGTVMWDGPEQEIAGAVHGVGVRLSDLSIAEMRSISDCVNRSKPKDGSD